jgi:uncharacterized membrane protein YphA (DoxX/SURF4 family)
MFNPFPELLVPFLAPTLLRIAVAMALFYLAYQQYARRGEIAQLKFPFIGKSSAWPGVVVNTLVGFMFLFGYYTQVAALVAIVMGALGLWANKRYPSVVILSNSTIILIMVIALSLFISGAGLFAQDVFL